VAGRNSINVRVIAATNADLKKGMAAGIFVRTCFIALAVVQIILPTLRDRESDICAG